MERVVYLYRDGRQIGAYIWNNLPLREQAVLDKSQELFGHRRPCGRQRRVIRTALLLELEQAMAGGGRVCGAWKRCVNVPDCDQIRFGQR